MKITMHIMDYYSDGVGRAASAEYELDDINSFQLNREDDVTGICGDDF